MSRTGLTGSKEEAMDVLEKRYKTAS